MTILFFLGKRILQGALVMLAISILAFSIRDNLGDPLRELLGQSVSEEVRHELRQEMGLNDPFFIQYGRFLRRAAVGDFGDSYFFKKPALEVILKKFPATFELVATAALIIAFISIPAGVYCAIRPRKIAARAIMAMSIVGISIPIFLTAIFCIYLFSVQLGNPAILWQRRHRRPRRILENRIPHRRRPAAFADALRCSRLYYAAAFH